MEKHKTIYDFEVTRTNGQQLSLSEFSGKVLLITNTATGCGLAPQFTGLQDLYEKYKDQGFEILAFPSNDFMNQEPLTGEELSSFCSLNFDTTFPIFERIVVKGKDAHPLFKYLSDQSSKPKWNFHKYLIDSEGQVVRDFLPITSPENGKISKLIEKELERA